MPCPKGASGTLIFVFHSRMSSPFCFAIRTQGEFSVSEDVIKGAQAPKAIIEAPHIHIDVHIHLDGRTILAQGGNSFAQPTARRDRGQVSGTAIVEESATRKTSWGRGVLAAAGVAIGVWLVGSVGYRVGSGAATPPSVASAKLETSGRAAEGSANHAGLGNASSAGPRT